MATTDKTIQPDPEMLAKKAAAAAAPAAAPATPAVPAPATLPAPVPAPGTTDPFSAQAKAVADTGQFTPTTGTFDESKGVEGRVASITSSGSPLMQLAETRAKQAANRSGLMNTSMAVGAGQKALIESAVPIAAADAEAFQRQGLTNQADQNAAAAQNAQIRASAATEGMRLGESARQAQADLVSRETMASLDREQQTALTNLEYQWRADMQANEKLAGAWGTMMENINQIQMNKDLEGPAKTQMIQQVLDQFGSYASWTKKVSGVDVGDLLNFSTAPPPGTTPTSAPAAAPTAPGSKVPTTPKTGGYFGDWQEGQGGA